MSNDFILANSTTAITMVDLNASVYVAAGVTLATTNVEAINGDDSGYATIAIDGHVVSNVVTIGWGTNASYQLYTDVMIGTGGSVVSLTSSAMYFTQSNVDIINHGTIIGGTSGIWINGFENYIQNFGTITGNDTATISMGTGTVINSGTIAGTQAAISVLGSVVIVNHGMLSTTDVNFATVYAPQGYIDFTNTGNVIGASAALNFDVNTITIFANSGMIEGTVTFGNLIDTATVSGGEINGDIYLKNGTNTFTITDGLLHGEVSSGTDADIFRLLGGRSLDDVNAGAGSDQIFIDGFQTTGTVTGGVGNDTYTIRTASADVSEAALPSELQDIVRTFVDWTLDDNFEILILFGKTNLRGTGNDAANTMTGNIGDNRLDGQGGADLIQGGKGADTILGGGGTDTARYASSTSAVIVDLLTGTGRGGHANGDRLSSIENLEGSLYADRLKGHNGVNILDGSLGNDQLTGARGRDTFVFYNGYGIDTITDFTNGADKIRLAGYTTFDSFDDLVIRKRGANVIMDFADETAGDRIVVLNATVKQFDASDFTFI